MSAIVQVSDARITHRESSRAVPKFNLIDRTIAVFSPEAALRRVQARTALHLHLRHYDGASPGRRTSGWRRAGGDANTTNRAALAPLRAVTRDLVRNNGWSRKGVQVIGNNTIGWGIKPRFGTSGRNLARLWNRWANSTKCHLQGRRTFYGLQRLAMDTVVQSGGALVIRHRRSDAKIPLQLEVLEPDYIDLTKELLLPLQKGGNIIVQGVEFDSDGRRVAYYLHNGPPGGSVREVGSRRVSAKDVLHVMREDRPGQVHGIPWFAPVVVKIHDFDDYEDALLMRQKIAACFSAFVTNVDGTSSPIGVDGESDGGGAIDTLEPGAVQYLQEGEEISFASPPAVTDNDSFSKTNLRAIAAGLGTSYEDLTGDYTGVNFSSARMSRLAHYGNVHDWRWNMIIPLMCDPVFEWFVEAAIMVGALTEDPADPPVWTPPPMAMIDPEKEGLAYKRNIRSGAMTHDEMVLELGNDPDEHWANYAAGLKRLDKLKIVLDSDARKTSEQGQAQVEGAKSETTESDT